MVLQPVDERREAGSHYTPRSLTEPIVRTTLRPILERLGRTPTPEQILDLKVCDPAMGSGAFLVEACRQLAEALVKAWHAHDCVPSIPPDEDEILHARRIVAQRCLYGVDKNPMAVDLAKLSLWLATLAKDHPFTFLDHALRCGDSLVGLSREQIEGFHWKPEQAAGFRARGHRGQDPPSHSKDACKIQNASEFEPYLKLDQELALAEEALDRPRFYGDLVVSAFFAGSNDRAAQGPARRAGRNARRPPGQSGFPRALSRPRGGTQRTPIGREAGHAVSLGDRVSRGLRPGRTGLRRDRRQSAVHGRNKIRETRAIVISTGSRRSTRNRMATPTSSPISSAARSTFYDGGAPSA